MDRYISTVFISHPLRLFASFNIAGSSNARILSYDPFVKFARLLVASLPIDIRTLWYRSIRGKDELIYDTHWAAYGGTCRHIEKYKEPIPKWTIARGSAPCAGGERAPIADSTTHIGRGAKKHLLRPLIYQLVNT